MKFHNVSDLLTPSRYNDQGQYESEAIVTVQLRAGWRPHRFGLGFVDETGECRREYGKPMEPGPYAYAFGLSTCISSDPRMGTGAEMRAARAAGLVIDAELGDVLVFPGSLWRIDRAHNDNLKLVQVNLVPVAAATDPARNPDKEAVMAAWNLP